jgi:hypothetical protein
VAVLRGEGTTCETTTPPMSLPKRGEQRIDPDHREGHEAAAVNPLVRALRITAARGVEQRHQNHRLGLRL